MTLKLQLQIKAFEDDAMEIPNNSYLKILIAFSHSSVFNISEDYSSKPNSSIL